MIKISMRAKTTERSRFMMVRAQNILEIGTLTGGTLKPTPSNHVLNFKLQVGLAGVTITSDLLFER